MMRIHVGALVSFPSAKKASIVEHIFGHWVESPEVALSRISWFARNFDETVVEAQIVTYGVLPGRKFLLVVAESEGEEGWNRR